PRALQETRKGRARSAPGCAEARGPYRNGLRFRAAATKGPHRNNPNAGEHERVHNRRHDEYPIRGIGNAGDRAELWYTDGADNQTRQACIWHVPRTEEVPLGTRTARL